MSAHDEPVMRRLLAGERILIVTESSEAREAWLEGIRDRAALNLVARKLRFERSVFAGGGWLEEGRVVAGEVDVLKVRVVSKMIAEYATARGLTVFAARGTTTLFGLDIWIDTTSP